MDTPAAIPVHAAPARTSIRGACGIVWRASLVSVLGMISVLHLAVLGLIAPRYREVYSDFGVQLSGLSLQVLALSRWLTGDNPGQRIPGFSFVAVLLPLALVLAWPISRTRAGILLLVLLIIVSVLLLAATFAGLWTPMTLMIESLQNSPQSRPAGR
jgi:hypothetical protein